MTKHERIAAKITENKDLLKRIKATMYNGQTEQGAITDFIDSAISWIKAVKSGRMACIVKHVSSSGMTRRFIYTSYERTGYYRVYDIFLKQLGYTVKNRTEIIVSGYGSDMNFNTCYNIAYKLCDLGFMSKKERAVLSQITPTVF